MEIPVCKLFIEFTKEVYPDYKFTGKVTECEDFHCDPDCIILSFRNLEKLVRRDK